MPLNTNVHFKAILTFPKLWHVEIQRSAVFV